ncbi:MAG: helix-turn-helix transcriptional regulator, partial [Christensenellaceae bacterium]
MDCKKVGILIRGLRKEKKLTQKQLADAMNISDKTISKWERGLGCPDVSLLHGLS